MTEVTSTTPDKPIYKSDYMDFLRHPAWLWLKRHDATKLPEGNMVTEGMAAAGYAFEAVAEHLFPEAVRLGFESHQEFEDLTTVTKAILENDEGVRTIIQAKFEADGLACICDVIHVDGKNVDLYEIKSSTKVKDTHVYDLAFQAEVIRRNGYDIRSVTVLNVNKEYVRDGEVDPQGLVTYNDVTQRVLELEAPTNLYIPQALATVALTECVDMSVSELGPVGSVSEWLQVYRHAAQTPDFSIYDLASPKKELLVGLEKDGVEMIADIPAGTSLTAKQELQVLATKQEKPIINHEAIKAFLGELEFPLYFLDYETYSTVVPYFDGQRPYQQIPFQFSVHVLDSPDAELRHVEFLQTEGRDSVADLSEALRAAVGTVGSIVTWNMSFEKGCNTTMGKLKPEFQEFYEGVNGRIVDLCVPFKDGMYVDHRFKGSYSIKNVLPVMAPEHSYKMLEIGDGGSAQILWTQAVLDGNEAVDKEALFAALLEYCGLDTLAMVEIYRKLAAL